MSGWRLSPIMVVLWTQQQWLLRIHLSILTTQHQSKIVSGIVFRKGSNTSFMILLLSQFLLPHSITLIMLSEQRIVTLSIIDMGQLVRPIHIPQIIIIMQLVQLMLMHTPTAIAIYFFYATALWIEYSADGYVSSTSQWSTPNSLEVCVWFHSDPRPYATYRGYSNYSNPQRPNHDFSLPHRS